MEPTHHGIQYLHKGFSWDFQWISHGIFRWGSCLEVGPQNWMPQKIRSQICGAFFVYVFGGEVNLQQITDPTAATSASPTQIADLRLHGACVVIASRGTNSFKDGLISA